MGSAGHGSRATKPALLGFAIVVAGVIVRITTKLESVGVCAMLEECWRSELHVAPPARLHEAARVHGSVR